MTENSERCCTCTTPEITIKLNKQGPQGLTGPQGEPGFSPVIEVSEETPTSYRLSIQTIDGSYETPNLKANFPLGGYVNQVLVKQSNADGDATWDYIPYATTETTGGLTLATEDDVVVGSDKAITGDILAKVVAGYVDLTSTQTITGAKTFDNNLTVTNGHTVDTDWLNVRNEYISMDGHSVIAREENNPVSGFNYNEYFRIGGNLPLLLYNVNDHIKIWRDSSAHIIVDADNIGDYIPDTVVKTSGNQTISGYKTFSKHLEVVEAIEVRYSNGSVQRGEINPTTDGGTISVYTPSNWCGQMGVREYNSDTKMWLQAPYQSSALYINNYSDSSAPSGNANTVIISGSNIKSQRNSQTYTILDSGNISSDPYIASLVARIEALES